MLENAGFLHSQYFASFVDCVSSMIEEDHPGLRENYEEIVAVLNSLASTSDFKQPLKVGMCQTDQTRMDEFIEEV